MIREASGEQLNALRTTDPFYTRILSLYESYGGGYDFVGFWVQETDGDIVSAISRFEDKFSLYLTEKSDLEEVAAFLRFQGAVAIMADDRFQLDTEAGRRLRDKSCAIRESIIILIWNYIHPRSSRCTPCCKAVRARFSACRNT